MTRKFFEAKLKEMGWFNIGSLDPNVRKMMNDCFILINSDMLPFRDEELIAFAGKVKYNGKHKYELIEDDKKKH